jgi:predicted small secreted protein
MKLISKSIILLLIVGTLGMVGCNTVNGFGQDVSATGRGIQKAS